MNDIPQLSTDSEELRKRFMDPCRLGSEAEWWAKRRIEELEREDAAWRKLNEQADKTVDRAEQERDALLADNERLRDELTYGIKVVESYIINYGYSRMLVDLRDSHRKALAKEPE